MQWSTARSVCDAAVSGRLVHAGSRVANFANRHVYVAAAAASGEPRRGVSAGHRADNDSPGMQTSARGMRLAKRHDMPPSHTRSGSLLRWFAVVPLLTASACATDSADCRDCQGDEHDDETHPTGGDSGALKVVAPPGLTASGYAAQLKNDPRAPVHTLTPGSAKPVATGTYCVWTLAYYGGTSNRLSPDCSVVVSALTTTTYELGAMHFSHGRDETVLGFDLQHVAWNKLLPVFNGTNPIVHAAGQHTYQVIDTPALLFPMPVTLSPGVVTKVDITAFSRRAIRVLPAPNRVLPNTGNLTACTRGAMVSRCAQISGLAKPLLIYGVDGDDKLQIGATDISSFPASTTIKDIQLERIDLNHVDYTMPDGSHRAVAGTATVTMIEGASGPPTGALTVTGLRTGTGLDVPAGVYDVRTSYTDPVTGRAESTTERLDLR